MLGRWAKHAQPEQQHEAEQAMGGSMWEGLRQIFANPFMRTMAILMILGDMIGTIAYALVIDYSKATFASDAVARTAFAADMDIATNVLQVVVQLTLTRFILARFGAPWVIAIWASAGVSVCLATAFSPDATTPVIGAMPWVALMLIVTRGLVYGMFSPAKESLFTKVPRSLRYKGKNATETAVWRAGDVISALVVNALNASKAGVAVFALIGGSAIAASGVITWRLARRVEGGAFDPVTKNAQTTP
jgi:AAA family ATP:ADP antiporter